MPWKQQKNLRTWVKSKYLSSTLAVADSWFAKKRSKKETIKSKLTLLKAGISQERMSVGISHFSLCLSAACPVLCGSAGMDDRKQRAPWCVACCKGWKKQHCLDSEWGKAVPVYRCLLQAPGCLLTSFITTLMGQASTEVNYSCGGGGETTNL